jgi:hypothetical protein
VDGCTGSFIFFCNSVRFAILLGLSGLDGVHSNVEQGPKVMAITASAPILG